MSRCFTILLAEDDRNMNYMLTDNLQMAGYTVQSFSDGQAALSGFLAGKFDLCILDVMLPRKDGFTLAAEIRKINLRVPLLFLTARAMKEDRIQGFRAGADDYVTKPFSVEELLLRIQTILKRVYHEPTTADRNYVVKIGDVTCNFATQQLECHGRVYDLTNKESRLLQLFCINVDKVIERDAIQKAIWEDEGYFVGRSLDVFISRLRKLLSVDPTLSIVNVHGVGYRLSSGQQQNGSQLP